jgi:hypothetical protein
VRIANFNHECYLPLYRQASDDAVSLVLRYPGRYVSTRGSALVMSYRISYAGYDEPSTWMDKLYGPLLVELHTAIPMDDWNLPLLPGGGDLDVTVTLSLAAATAFVLVRGGLAAVRLARAGWHGRHDWPTGEVLWVLVAFTVAVVVMGGDLVEFGENSRFRTTVDPLLVALPLAWLVNLVNAKRRGPLAPASSDGSLARGQLPEPASEPPAPPGPDSPAPADGRPTTAARSPFGPPG